VVEGEECWLFVLFGPRACVDLFPKRFLQLVQTILNILELLQNARELIGSSLKVRSYMSYRIREHD
jgi:hypothetical protein